MDQPPIQPPHTTPNHPDDPEIAQLVNFVKFLASALYCLHTHIIEPISNFLQSEGVQSDLSGLLTYINEFPSSTRELLAYLANEGWFFDPEMGLSDIYKLKHFRDAKNFSGIADYLVTHFNSRKHEIKESLISSFPHRRYILHDAFAAHERQEYNLSTPIFIIQADGICKELTGANLVLKEDGKPKVARVIRETFKDDFESSFIYPLTQPLKLCESEKQRDCSVATLNRHTVLHGEAIDYGTEINSLKSISLVNYVGSFLSEKLKPSTEAHTLPPY